MRVLPAVVYAGASRSIRCVAGSADGVRHAVGVPGCVAARRGLRQITPPTARRVEITPPTGESRHYLRELVRHGATVVSGLAQGVDTIAHTTAMIEGRTIAVIGTPLDDVFPRQNAALQAHIASQDLVVSEFAPGSRVSKGNFPRRNRTMALIADASVIVEAGDGSGTLSHGWEALRIGRPLFFLRSLLDAELEWPRKMMTYGARALPSLDELLAALPCDDIRRARSVPGPGEGSADDVEMPLP